MTSDYAYFLSIVAARSVVVIVFIVILLRIMGKRQIGQFNVYDMALLMALANAVQNAMTSGKGELSVGITAAGALLVFGRLFALGIIKFPRAESALIGSPTILIHDGKIHRAHLHHELVTEQQLMQVIRGHGLTNIAQVKLAILEVDGSITLIPVVSVN